MRLLSRVAGEAKAVENQRPCGRRGVRERDRLLEHRSHGGVVGKVAGHVTDPTPDAVLAGLDALAGVER